MRFSLTSTVVIMAGLTIGGSAFVINTFSGTNCRGVVERDVNIWDDTCAAWPKGFRSYKITTWGGRHQYAYFFAPGECRSRSGAIGQGYVDSTTFDFELNHCYDFDGATANAIGSYEKI